MNKILILFLGAILMLNLVSASYGIGNSNSYGIGAKEVSGTTNINNSYTNITNINNVYSTSNNGILLDILNITNFFYNYNTSSDRVPYTGATQSVDLNNKNLTNLQRLGIGTTAPAYTLDLSSTSNNIVARIKSNATSSSTAGAVIQVVCDDGANMQNEDRLGGIEFGGAKGSAHAISNSTGIYGFAEEQFSTTKQGAGLAFATSLNGGLVRSERMRIDNAGNVGIGKTTPQSKLDVNGTANFTGDVKPTVTATHSLGSSTLRWLKGWFVNLDVSQNLTVGGLINTTNGVYIGGNIIVQGNMSIKRPYWNGYDNSTQNNCGTTCANVMNISNNNDNDHWQMNILGNQNLTFQSTGDYLCILSPEFFAGIGVKSEIGFWYQKNGVDVAWSNSRYTVSAGDYNAPAIPFQFDIENPATDTIRFMWMSSNANTVIYSSGALTSPTRPSIPGVILNCQKVSELIP